MTPPPQDQALPLAIRAAVAEDEPAVRKITAEVFAPVSIDATIERMLGRVGAPWHDVKGDKLIDELRANPEGCFVAELKGGVVGYITTREWPSVSRGEIANLAVAAEWQGRGIGRRLIEHALARFRRMGLQRACISTLEPNAVGRHLYPAMGFQEAVREIRYVMPL